MGTSAEIAAISSKKQRGRYKKLSKRASRINSKCELSGICHEDDWNELSSYRHPQDVSSIGDTRSKLLPSGPSIIWRNGKVMDRVNGEDHRDILQVLLSSTTGSTPPMSTSSKKRKGCDVPDGVYTAKKKIPHWATLHNPVAAEHIGIIEVHLPNKTVLRSLKEVLLLSTVTNLNNVWHAETKWFSSSAASASDYHEPQSISRAIMYVPVENKVVETRDQSTTAPATVNDVTDLFRLLSQFCLTQNESVRAGYPSRDESTTPTRERKPTFPNNRIIPSELPVEAAKELIQNHTIETSACNDARQFSVPFVSHHASDVPQWENDRIDEAVQRPAAGKIFAVDCEMVETTAGTELARVTLVELQSFTRLGQQHDAEHLEPMLLWDCLVRPRHPVVNYLTMYSGMTAALLEGDAVQELEQVQAALLSTVRPNDILIGHSLENDLQALRFIHTNVVDTALLFQPNNGLFKYSLRTLAAKLLSLEIQRPHQPHCSQQDATTALKLACRRAICGPSFGIGKNRHQQASQVMNQIHSVEGTTVCVGPSGWLRRHVTCQPSAAHALSCESIRDGNQKAIASWLTGPNRRARLVWGRFHLANHDDDTIALGAVVQQILAKLPSNGLLLVLLQPGFDQAQQLTQLRKTRKNPKTTIQWTDKDEQNWVRVVDECRIGHSFWLESKSDTSK
jgi:DNA polymerase III epsilon subunit-like protein